MPRQMMRLSPKAVTNKKEPGYYLDGGGLYLQVGPSGSKSWLFRFALAGRERQMGLGALDAVSLAQARNKAADARKLLAQRIDPIEARKAAESTAAASAASRLTFAQCAAAYIKAHRSGWKNEKHAEQWENTIETYCGPVMGSAAAQSIDTALVLRVLEPIWSTKAETATRLRARIERVLDWAVSRGYRTPGENPARWRGHMDNLLPKLQKRKRVKHHPALPYTDAANFMVSLRTQDGLAARALEFTILTAARTGEVIGARRREFDLDAALWTIPAERMKAHREHRVPLSTRVVEVLRSCGIDDLGHDDFVFPGMRTGQPMSNMAMLQLLARMARDDITVHGFRSTFRDWAAERTSYPREVAEMALAHTISDQTEAAYRRGDLFEKRRRLMTEWAAFCELRKSARGKVRAINSAAQNNS